MPQKTTTYQTSIGSDRTQLTKATSAYRAAASRIPDANPGDMIYVSRRKARHAYLWTGKTLLPKPLPRDI
jgi:uncharacterized protein YfaT (DUF1175 family)